ncbi:MAG: polyphosphate kinase 1 [Ferruginibacter sp.]|nr:polyphosphate kinase 1 [Cytophagales bacterium]
MSLPNPYFNRDLSWLSFNYRVLMEARDPEVPLAQRIRFLAIFSSNLDEFFRVRVASLRTLTGIKRKKLQAQHLDFDPREVLASIHDTVDEHQREYGRVFRDQILPDLRRHRVILYQEEPLREEHQHEVSRIFRSKVLSYLQPVFIGAGNRSKDTRKLPFLDSKTLYFAISLRRRNSPGPSPGPSPGESASGGETTFAYLNIPSDKLTRFVELSPLDGCFYYVFIDDIIRANLGVVFPGYEVLGCFSFKLNRAEDNGIDDEYDGDLVEKVKAQLDKRKTAPPIRFLYDAGTPAELLALFTRLFDLHDDDLMPGGRYHNLSDLTKLPVSSKPGLAEPAYPALVRPELEASESMFDAIDQQDRIIHFPYQSYDYVLRFFNEAAIDPFVYEIKVTLYRIATNSLIANALISAAKNGKRVTVFVEVKARFDEANNLRWAKEMEEAGIHLIYSIPGLKVHAKVALIKRRNPFGVPSVKHWDYAYFGTGNFNEVTAGVYADHGLFTCHRGMIKEMEKVFHYLKKQKEVRRLRHLLVARFNMQDKYLALIDREITFAGQGEPASLIIKLNGLEERTMIDKLYEAARAGEKVDLIIRGIC